MCARAPKCKTPPPPSSGLAYNKQHRRRRILLISSTHFISTSHLHRQTPTTRSQAPAPWRQGKNRVPSLPSSLSHSPQQTSRGPRAIGQDIATHDTPQVLGGRDSAGGRRCVNGVWQFSLRRRRAFARARAPSPPRRQRSAASLHVSCSTHVTTRLASPHAANTHAPATFFSNHSDDGPRRAHDSHGCGCSCGSCC